LIIGNANNGTKGDNLDIMVRWAMYDA
jgi:hypothetical protein